MDGGQLYAVLPIIDPETTLFIIASKSFGTIDTLANVNTDDPTQNIPTALALLGLYNREERQINNVAILPYDGCLRYLPNYMQHAFFQHLHQGWDTFTADFIAVLHRQAPGFEPQGVIWGINSFDQPGVEKGKHCAVDILETIDGHKQQSFDPSTDAIIKRM